jgi:hypothetical protein
MRALTCLSKSVVAGGASPCRHSDQHVVKSRTATLLRFSEATTTLTREVQVASRDACLSPHRLSELLHLVVLLCVYALSSCSQLL